MNLVDRFVSFWDPEAGVRRILAREALATYPDAIARSLDPPITAPGTSADWDLELGQDRRKLVDRVRQMERENPFASTILDRTVELVVGHGFRLVPRTKDVKWNIKFMRLWRSWCRKENCDSRKILPLHTGMALTFRGYLRDGESGYIKLKNGRLRTLESDEIGNPGGYIRPGEVDGITLNDDGSMKTFHIFRPNMNYLYADRRISGDRIDVPAEHVIFRAHRIRTSQTRGLTRFNGVFWPLDQIKGSIEAMTVSLRMAACIGLVIKRATPFNLPTSPDPNSSSGTSRVMKMTPGGVLHLLPGEDVTQVTPTAPGPQVPEHVRLLIRIACGPFGLPLEVAMGDFGPLNLSSARANLQQALRTAKNFQIEVESVYDEMADWKAVEWMESGELWKPNDPDPDAWREARHWVKPKHLVMDPVAEEQADLAAIDAGTKTYSQVAEERGTTIEELIEQRKMEKQMLEDAGLEPVHSTLTRDKTPPPAAPKGDGKPQDLEQVKASLRRSRPRPRLPLRAPPA